MFGIGIYELLTVLLVVCVVAKPDEVPYYLKCIKKFYNHLMKLKFEIYNVIEDENYIKGDDEVIYKSYAVKCDNKGDK